jgi:uncharacterized protein (TIGR00266 family)
MEFSIEHSPVFTVLRVQLSPGESFRAEPGAMLSMSPTIDLEAKTSGKGLFGALKAAVGGESFFASLYTAQRGEGEILLAPALPGEIIRLDLSGETIFAQGGAYLAGAPDLTLSAQGSFRAFAAGEGLFLSKISGSGVLFLNSYGAIYEKTLSTGESYIVDSGHMVAFQESVHYEVRKASRGIFSSLASGEGLVMHVTGPGKIWIQTRQLKSLADLIVPYLPNRS